MALDMFPCNPRKLLPAQQHEEGAAVVQRLQLQLQLSCDLLAVVKKMSWLTHACLTYDFT